MKNVGLLEGNINFIPNFCPSRLISKNSVLLVRKEAFNLFSGDIELIPSPARTAQIPAVDSCARRAPIFCCCSAYCIYPPTHNRCPEWDLKCS